MTRMYIDRLIEAQQRIIDDERETISYSSDGYDYYMAAKAIKRRLENIKRAKDPLAMFAKLIKSLNNYACDGICEELAALTPEDNS